MVRNVACFFTGGYSEYGYMQHFLEKINPELRFWQKLPNKPRRKASTSSDGKMIKDEFNGITGDSLIDKACECLSLPSVQEEIRNGDIDAILIEDDTDALFAGKDEEFINRHERRNINRLRRSAHKGLPVFFIYASPEIESWFISDWENGFGWIYTSSGMVNDLEINERKYFTDRLHKYIEGSILVDCDALEDFGYGCNGTYIKLSDELIHAIQTDVKKSISVDSKANVKYVSAIINSKELYYSKWHHGSMMLKNIEPDNVVVRCNKYFSRGYYRLKEFR